MPIRLLHMLFALVWCGNLFAQTKPIVPPYKQYTLRDGLSQMQVISLFQDSRNYIWVGTKSGLNCFNGEKFISYTSKKYPEMASDYIAQICEDSYGRIWASTPSGIIQIDGHQTKFFNVKSDPMPWIAAGEQGRLWCVSGKYPSIEFDISFIENDSIYAYPIQIQKKNWYPHLQLHFLKDEKKLLLAKGSELYSINNHQAELIDSIKNPINFIARKESVYYVECFEPFLSADMDSRNFDLKQFKNGQVERLASVRSGKYLGEVNVKEPVAYATLRIQPMIYLLSSDSVNSLSMENIQPNKIISDVENNIWIGAEEGFYQLYGKAFTAYNREYLPQIWAVTEDQNKAIWFSSFYYGLTKFEDGKITRYPNQFIKNADYPYFHPVVDKRGRLFFPNSYGFLMVDGQKFEQVGENFFLTSYYDIEHDLVWGGKTKAAVAFDAKRDVVRTIDSKQGLDVGTNVLTIGKDTSGEYWFGGGTGLARYNWTSNSLKNYKPGNQNAGVYTQRNDFTGRTWFGTKDGLYWYNAKADSLCKIERDELDDVVNMLEPIDSSWLIVSQPYGIYLLDLQAYYKKNKIRLHLFNEKNGFLGIEPGQDGAFTDSKGNVWMTTSTELMKLDPRKLNPGKNHLNIRIDKLNGHKIPFTCTELVLPLNQHSAVIGFDAICFNRPNPVKYSWKLDSDTAWSAWQEEDYAILDNLGDGKTNIQVRAMVKGLPLDEIPQVSCRIVVRLSIFRQPWFLPFLFAAVTFAGIIIFLFTLLQMKKEGRAAKMFQIQAIQSQMNPHFIFNVLASLQAMILKSNISKANDYLVKLAELIRGFLEASAGTGIMKNPESNEGQVSIVAELALLKKYIEFQQVINPGRFDYSVHIDDNIDPEIELIPPLLIQPFIENSIRHGLLPSTSKGFLFLSFQKAKEVLIIEIQDNGVGIEKAQQMLEKSPMRYISRGTELTVNRIKLLNQLGFKIEIETYSTSETTRVFIKLHK